MSNRSGSKGNNTRNTAPRKTSGKKASSLPGSSSKKSDSATSQKMAHNASFPGTKPKGHQESQDGHILDMSVLGTSDPGFSLDLPYRIGHGSMFPIDGSSPDPVCSMSAMDPVHAFSPPSTECGGCYVPAGSAPPSPISMYPADVVEYPRSSNFHQNMFYDGSTITDRAPYGSVTRTAEQDAFVSSGVSGAPCFDEVIAHALNQSGNAVGYPEPPLDWAHQDIMTSKLGLADGACAMTTQSSQTVHSPASQASAFHPITHTSGPFMDDMDWHASLESVDDESLTPPGYTDGLYLPPASYPMDANSMRSSHALLGPSFNNDLCTAFPDHVQDSARIMPPFGYQPSSRRTSDGESTAKARKDPLYKALPGKDGLYHCPHEKDGCKHAPEKLKCNYDKHLDSHLKPYNCKYAKCSSLSFSSTACLLRHEREAHGLHGHGNNPYACLFSGCERAQPEKGFPRSWNLKDHMKRVHGYTVKDVPPRNYLTPPNSPDSLGPQLRSQGLDASKPAGTKKTKGKTTSKPTRRRASASTSGFQEELKAQIDRLGPQELARLQRCSNQGMDVLQQVCKREVY